MNAVVRAFDDMADLVGGDSVRVSLGPRPRTAVTHVAMVVTGIEVRGRVTPAVAALMEDRVDAWIGSEVVAVGRLAVLPDVADEPEQPLGVRAAHVVVEVDRGVVVVVEQLEQLVVLEPVLLPGGGR